MERLNLDKDSLRKFGITMAVAFLVITGIIFIKRKGLFWPTLEVSAAFLFLGLFLPLLLKPLYIAWMRFAFLLGWVNTRLILAVLFYLVFTPIGVILRVLNNDLLERKIDKSKGSYWKRKEQKTASQQDYERQF